MRNRKQSSVVSCRLSVAGTKSQTCHGQRTTNNEQRSPRSSRRGVLLLVVLSMLVLFMLVGTAFLMSSNQSRIAMKHEAKGDRVGNYATKLLDRALMQILRDTDNPVSVIRYHSLLRDLYGTDGFQGVAYGWRNVDPLAGDLGSTSGWSSRFAGALPPVAQQRGPTEGQFIDIYFKKATLSVDDPGTLDDESIITNPDIRHVLKLDRDPYGKPQLQTLPLTRGYYNGCLLTITSGPAAGQSARIVDYENVGSIPGAKPNTVAAQIFRFRVMAFQRSDGQPLTISPGPTAPKSRSPEIEELAGIPGVSSPATFMVNGRAFGGTGVGYNPLAVSGQPRLSALELFDPATGATATTASKTSIGGEIALLPNSVYINPLQTAVGAAPSDMSGKDPFVTPLPVAALGTYTASKYWPLNFIPATGTPTFFYPNFVGPGGANEGYDAADFQNMALALQTVTPRSQGRVLHKSGATSVSLDLSDPLALTDTQNFLRLDLEDVPLPSFHRPDLVNYWNHRLFNYLTGIGSMKPDDAVRAIVQPYDSDPSKPLWSLNPSAGGLTAANAALISAIKRQVMLRPTREDHPHFDGSNPQSSPPNLSGLSSLAVSGNIAVPIWETTGPWDVDNDNDGVRDSVWVDLGDPIQETEDGRRYKPLYAFLCVDMDSRLNVNAHGLADDILPPLLDTTKANYFDPTHAGASWAGNLAHDAATGGPATIMASTLQLARGLGYGPADISLRPLFPAPLNTSFNPIFPTAFPFRPNQDENVGPVDSYATLLFGRLNVNGKVINGRYGNDLNLGALKSQNPSATAGTNYEFQAIPNKEPVGSPRWLTGERATPSVKAQLKFFDYPWSFWNAASWNPVPGYYTQRNSQSAFGTMPDLKGRYALGLDYAGQPVYEAAGDVNPSTLALTPKLPHNLLANTPYELDLSGQQRRDNWASKTNSFGPLATPNSAFDSTIDRSFVPSSPDFKTGLNDDAAYSPTDLEKVLRATDADSGTLPSRLWDVVNDFDPLKLMDFDPNHIQFVASNAFGSTNQPALLASAQATAGINRQLVTTDSFDLPVTTQTMPAYVSEFGADGYPGRRKPNPTATTPDPLNTPGSDDFQVIMAARDGLPNTQINLAVSRATAKITDLVYYRVWLEARRYEMNRQKLTEVAIDAMSVPNYATFMRQIKGRVDRVYATFPQLQSELLAPEVVAGKKMDLNRPFGDGKDNNGDGVVDDPLEAGDPFLDINGNGKWDPGEPYIDLFGAGTYVGPGVPHPTLGNICDQLWSSLTANGTLAEPITFDYTNGHAEPVHKLIAQALNVKGGVRNLDSQGRQLFARQLYCLALLLMDENYIAPWDEKDPQINKLLDQTVVGGFAQRLRVAVGGAVTVPETPDANLYRARVRAMLLRKLTCRTIAQWAVNVVDARDSDVIMTPFEYDENPWDGWGEWDDNWNADPDPNNTNSTFKNSTFLPLDGDPATNENDAWIIDWSKPTATPGRPKTFAQLLFVGGQPTISTNAPTTTNPPIITVPFNQTRGIVWGVERPELLITETLAWHDRRTDDRQGDSNGKHSELKPSSTDNQHYVDIDMDQHLRPKGSLFVELYNPWSPDGQYPSELYTKLDETDWDATNKRYKLTPAQGVDLTRLSNFGVNEAYNTLDVTDPNNTWLTPGISGFDTNTSRITKRSPVWRLIVVDDWPRARNRERARIGNDQSQTGPTTTSNSTPQFTGYNQHLGNVPPDVKLNMPAGVTATSTGLPAYLAPMVGTPTTKDTIEGWDATQAPPYRAPDPDLEDVFNAGYFDATTGAFTKSDGGFNGAFTPTQVASVLPAHDSRNVNLFNVEYPYIEREFYFTTDNSPTAVTPTGLVPWGQFIDNGIASKPKDWDYSPNSFKVRVPDRFMVLSGFTGLGTGTRDVPNGPPLSTNAVNRFRPRTPYTWARSQKFIPIALEQQKAPNAPVVAPILPGRYGVIGTAGARFFRDTTNPNIFSTTVGRPDRGNTKFTTDAILQSDYNKARRIEMRPNPNPNLQQLVVAANGGDPKDQIQLGGTLDPFSTEIGRDNELIRNDTQSPPTIENITMPDTTAGPNFGGGKYYQPCVAIPVEGMSASDPPWGWIPREFQAAGQEYDIAKAKADEHNRLGSDHWDASVNVYTFNPKGANGEGAYANSTPGPSAPEVSYDKPFDIAPELLRTGTTPNYRTTHLQRLANPELPWNPLPGQYQDVSGTDLYRPSLPVNPYRTIDSSTINLTTFNGTSSEEHNIGTTADQAMQEGKLRPWERAGGGAGGAPSELNTYLDGLTANDPDPQNTTKSPKQAMMFKSVERGWWSRLSESGRVGTTPANTGVATPQRMLWSQEPALVDLRRPQPAAVLGTLPPTGMLIDLIDGRQMSMRVLDELPNGASAAPKNPGFGGTMDNLMENSTPGSNTQHIMFNHCDLVMKHTLGFGNESFGLLYDKIGARKANFPNPGPKSSAPPLATAIGVPAPSRFVFPYDTSTTEPNNVKPDAATVSSTYPWLAWDNRPYVSGDEILKVPAASQSQLMRQYSGVDPNVATANRANPYGLASIGLRPVLPVPAIPPPYPAVPNAVRRNVMQAPFGALANMLAASGQPAGVVLDTDWLQTSDANSAQFGLPSGYVPKGVPVRFDATGVPLIPDDPAKDGSIRPYGAANLSRLLDYVQVPSRFVGTDTMLNAETFNDVPGVNDNVNTVGTAVGTDIADSSDPRYNFQPPFNKVSRERDPGKVNLNTVTGRRTEPTATLAAAQIWSEVYDGIMHRFHDANLATENRLGHFGPAWRDVVLSRRGYVQFDAAGNSVDKPPVVAPKQPYPDTFEAGLNNNFPTLFANPFRSADAGDLVPLVQMMQYGVDASMERVHPRNRGMLTDASGNPIYDPSWGSATWPTGYTPFNDARDAGFGNDGISFRIGNFAIPETATSQNPTVPTQRDTMPLFSELRGQSFADTNRNPYMMYEPMSRLNNLVTNRSGVYAVWITVGYFEVEKAPDWNDPDATVQANVRAHFGNDINLYNRAYPDGYMLGKELGSETGDIKRPRGFYIIDRTEEVGFKPGEDLNVEKTIRLRRRIE
jgi:hypothetical protein